VNEPIKDGRGIFQAPTILHFWQTGTTETGTVKERWI